jgi:hypothetical protein
MYFTHFWTKQISPNADNSDLYMGHAQFEFQLGHSLSWLRVKFCFVLYCARWNLSEKELLCHKFKTLGLTVAKYVQNILS